MREHGETGDDMVAGHRDRLWQQVRYGTVEDKLAAADSVFVTDEQLAVLSDPRVQEPVVRRAAARRFTRGGVARTAADPDPTVRQGALSVRGLLSGDASRELVDDDDVVVAGVVFGWDRVA